MSIFFPIVFLLMLIVITGLLGSEGLWSNAIMLFHVLIAALVATNVFEPLANQLTHWVPTAAYLWDFPAIWGSFAVSLLMMRVSTDLASRYKVRFPKLINGIGGYFFAGWMAWVLICFTSMSLHTAPLPREFLFGAFQAERPLFFGLYPDRMWLGFSQRMSQGTFSRGKMFDPNGEFLIKYATRREKYEQEQGTFNN